MKYATSFLHINANEKNFLSNDQTSATKSRADQYNINTRFENYYLKRI
jgi:hypothetical protein